MHLCVCLSVCRCVYACVGGFAVKAQWGSWAAAILKVTAKVLPPQPGELHYRGKSLGVTRSPSFSLPTLLLGSTSGPMRSLRPSQKGKTCGRGFRLCKGYPSPSCPQRTWELRKTDVLMRFSGYVTHQLLILQISLFVSQIKPGCGVKNCSLPTYHDLAAGTGTRYCQVVTCTWAAAQAGVKPFVQKQRMITEMVSMEPTCLKKFK